MPTTKNALLRYQILDQCLNDKYNRYTLQDLIDKVNDVLGEKFQSSVSRRQIQYDLDSLGTIYGANIVKVHYSNKCIIRYEDQRYSIFNNMLSEEDIQKLRATIDVLGKYKGLIVNEWIEEVISSLEYRCGVKANDEYIISFQQNERLKGLSFLSTVIEAAEKHIPLKILYRTYKGRESLTVVHPYHLKQYNNRWFLMGLEQVETGTRITNKALDRIVHIEKADVDFIPNTAYNFSTFFDDVIGVTLPRNATKEKILLKFDKARFPYVVSKPIHNSQKIVSLKNREISIEVIPNKELDSLILSYGPQVEVIEPASYRERIKDMIRTADNLYR